MIDPPPAGRHAAGLFLAGRHDGHSTVAFATLISYNASDMNDFPVQRRS